MDSFWYPKSFISHFVLRQRGFGFLSLFRFHGYNVDVRKFNFSLTRGQSVVETRKERVKGHFSSLVSRNFLVLLPRWTRFRALPTGVTRKFHGRTGFVYLASVFHWNDISRFPWWFPDMKRLVKSMERSQATGSRLEVITVSGTTKSVDLHGLNFFLGRSRWQPPLRGYLSSMSRSMCFKKLFR